MTSWHRTGGINSDSYRKTVIAPVAHKVLGQGHAHTVKRLAASSGFLGCATDPLAVLTTGWWDCPDGTSVAVEEESIAGAGKPIEQVLSILGEVSGLNYNFTPYGNLHVPGGVSLVQNATASLCLRAPQNGAFNYEWRASVENLNTILNSSTSLQRHQNGLVDVSFKDCRIKINHSLFTPKSDPLARKIPQFYGGNTMDDYPEPPCSAASSFEIIKGSHVVNVAPIYTPSGALVFPTFWEEWLRGSLVECYFALQHIPNLATETSTVTAELREIVILFCGMDRDVERPLKHRGDSMEWYPHCIATDVEVSLETPTAAVTTE